MKPAEGYSLVLVTAPGMKAARKLARAALKKRLIACANLIPKIESHYRWKDKIESGSEVLLLLKTTAGHVAELEKLILAKHSYDTPEFLVIPLQSGSAAYLEWLSAATQPPPTRKAEKAVETKA